MGEKKWIFTSWFYSSTWGLMTSWNRYWNFSMHVVSRELTIAWRESKRGLVNRNRFGDLVFKRTFRPNVSCHGNYIALTCICTSDKHLTLPWKKNHTRDILWKVWNLSLPNQWKNKHDNERKYNSPYTVLNVLLSPRKACSRNGAMQRPPPQRKLYERLKLAYTTLENKRDLKTLLYLMK